MAELHIVGRILSARDFKQSHLLCKWSFHAGNKIFIIKLSLKIYFFIVYIYIFNFFFIGRGWKVLNGYEEGQTQESCDLYTNEPVWDHPIDLHYTTQTIQNSPKILLQIFHRDTHGRILFGSYGICNIPLSPGLHSIKCHTWKPIGNLNFF